ncbi:MAG: LD-carboxypeptidase [Candidatus Aenigmatarchaeota archaeon]
MEEKVRLITPSSKITDKKLRNARRFVKKLGYEVTFSEAVKEDYLDFAGRPETRIEDINSALQDNSEILWCIRGGYGSIQILEEIEYDKIKQGKKIIGYSNPTLLLNAISSRTGIITFHGPMPYKEMKEYDKMTIESVKQALKAEDYSWKFDDKNVFVSGKTSGRVIAGNLNLFNESLGTAYEYDTDGKIIFLEQNNPKGQRIYDLLEQLRLAGKFEKAKGVILGNFNFDENKQYLKDFFKDFDIPVLYRMDFGHKEPNLTFPIGANCILDTDKGRLKFGLKEHMKSGTR